MSPLTDLHSSPRAPRQTHTFTRLPLSLKRGTQPRFRLTHDHALTQHGFGLFLLHRRGQVDAVRLERPRLEQPSKQILHRHDQAAVIRMYATALTIAFQLLLPLVREWWGQLGGEEALDARAEPVWRGSTRVLHKRRVRREKREKRRGVSLVCGGVCACMPARTGSRHPPNACHSP